MLKIFIGPFLLELVVFKKQMTSNQFVPAFKFAGYSPIVTILPTKSQICRFISKLLKFYIFHYVLQFIKKWKYLSILFYRIATNKNKLKKILLNYNSNLLCPICKTDSQFQIYNFQAFAKVSKCLAHSNNEEFCLQHL